MGAKMRVLGRLRPKEWRIERQTGEKNRQRRREVGRGLMMTMRLRMGEHRFCRRRNERIEQ
jgi:hypothetical protein